MVMYEDDNSGNLSLVYDYMPQASEIIRDLLDAPVEKEVSFFTKKKSLLKKPTVDEQLVVKIKNGKLSAKTIDQVINTMRDDYNWTVSLKDPLTFEIEKDRIREVY